MYVYASATDECVGCIMFSGRLSVNACVRAYVASIIGTSSRILIKSYGNILYYGQVNRLRFEVRSLVEVKSLYSQIFEWVIAADEGIHMAA